MKSFKETRLQEIAKRMKMMIARVIEQTTKEVGCITPS